MENAVSPAPDTAVAEPVADAATIESIADPAAPPPNGYLARIEAVLADGLAAMLAEMRGRAALDHFREEQVDRLHGELQRYRSDLAGQPARQVLLGLIRLHDDLGRTAAAVQRKDPAELTPETVLRLFADVRDDLELLLGQHGVEPFTGPGDTFDPRRQNVVRTVPSDDPACNGRIAERVRPGFEQGEALLQKERVAVYIHILSNDQPHGEPS
jgi:molecular chaperone GrpE (heat shock protein)